MAKVDVVVNIGEFAAVVSRVAEVFEGLREEVDALEYRVAQLEAR